MPTTIKKISGREILDSRGLPTVEAQVELSNGLVARASAPAGTDISQHEVKYLIDGDKRRYNGCGMLLAANHINEVIVNYLLNKNINDQIKIDQTLIELDGTDDKCQLGANTMIAVSFACARAGALNAKQELFNYLQATYNLSPTKTDLPSPLFNIFNGGSHADTNLDFQEFMIIPNLASPAFTASVHETKTAKIIRAGAEIYHLLAKILQKAGYDSDVGLEGGYAPDMDSSIKAIELMMAAIKQAKYKAGDDFSLGLDIGSALLFDEVSSQYLFSLDGVQLASTNLISLYRDWLSRYPISYLEDPLSDSQWAEWQQLTAELGNKLTLAGDDLFVGRPSRLRQGVDMKAANAVVLKPNQIGTLTESIEYAKIARKHNYALVVSHRSGETNDDFIVDLAVALEADFVKLGAVSRGERVAKFNRLLAIANLKS